MLCPSEIVSIINEISTKVQDLLSQRNKKDLIEKAGQLDVMLSLYSDISEMSRFINSVKLLTNTFLDNPSATNSDKSFLKLLSIISTEKSKIIEKYGLSSEPE